MKMNSHQLSARKAFTLIELLIVVAIIAILAAIAVPNFLEAQTRSKVSRTLADMRTMRTGIESYAVDNNHYPETDRGVVPMQSQRILSFFRLTTPVAYLTSIPASPWKENYGSGTGNPKLATVIPSYLYVRKENDRLGPAFNGDTTINEDYTKDRETYVMFNFNGQLVAPDVRAEAVTRGAWLLKSVGPDNIDDRDTTHPEYTGLPAVYDPTNGTVSRGDILTFSDISGTGKNL
jgi:type II secretion system protein G